MEDFVERAEMPPLVVNEKYINNSDLIECSNLTAATLFSCPYPGLPTLGEVRCHMV